MDINQMSIEELLRQQGFTGYTGENDHELEFSGGANSLIAEGTEIPFEIAIQNTANATKAAWLSPGNVVYAPGTTAGHLVDSGTMNAIGESGDTKSLTITMGTDQQKITEFTRMFMQHPTVVARVEIISTDGAAQSNLRFTRRRYNPLVTEPEIPVALNSGLLNSDFREKYLALPKGEVLFLSNLHYYKINIAASSTLTLKLYLGATQSSVKALENKVESVKQTIRSLPNVAAALNTDKTAQFLQLAGRS